jgi:hypothetical protein
MPARRRKNRIDTAHWSDWWRVSRRAVQQWLKEGKPVSAPAAMARIILASPNPAAGPRGRAEEVLIAEKSGRLQDLIAGPKGEAAPPPAGSPPPPSAPAAEDPPPAGVEEDIDLEAEGADPDLRSLRAFYHRKLRGAARINDQANLAYWESRFLAADKAIRSAELHERKLGLDQGAMLSRPEVERIVHAIAFWLVRGLDQDNKELCRRMLGLTFVEEGLAVLESVGLQRRLLVPFAKASTCDAGVKVPEWVVDSMREAVDDYCEGGATAFDAARVTAAEPEEEDPDA